jgi:undecaprenyl diphosphate synthase
MAGEMKPEDINRETFSRELYTANLPDVDLLIRTSGELRVSNFLLWQIAYAELFFTDVLWPDFSNSDLLNAIKHYQERERRFGLAGEQVVKSGLI